MIRLYNLCNLIFFALIFMSSCQNKHSEIAIVWNNNKAVALSIPKNLLDVTAADSINFLLQVRVEKSSSIAMLGDYIIEDDNILFKPLVPLSRGMGYEIFRNQLIAKIKVPLSDIADAPVW